LTAPAFTDFGKRWDILIVLVLVPGFAALAHLTHMLTVGDWDFWADFKDRQWWPLVSPVVGIIIPAAAQYTVWRLFGLPGGATAACVLLVLVQWASRFLSFHGLSYFPLPFVAPATFIPLSLLLDVTLVLTRSFVVTSIFGGLAWGLLFQPANTPLFAAAWQPVTYHGDVFTLADVWGFEYIRSQTPAYMRIVESGHLRAFLEQISVVTAFTAAFLCIGGYWVGQLIPRVITFRSAGVFYRTRSPLLRYFHPGKAAALALAVCATAAMLSPTRAEAHGERAQVPFLRTQAIAFWDVAYSRTHLEVGERLQVTGKFRLAENWPITLPEPETAFLTVISPGPVFLMKDRVIDGRFVAQSITPQKGRVHEFSMELQARRAGRWHIHPSLAVKKAGPLIGPGRWIEVEEGEASFQNVVALENGKDADLENHSLGSMLGWHGLWVLLGALFVVYWAFLPRRRLVSQMAQLHADREAKQWSFMSERRDIRFSAVVGAVTLAVLAAGVAYAHSAWPGTIPIQVRNARLVGADLGAAVEANPSGPARFDGSQMDVTVELTNRESVPLSLERFVLADLSFAPGDDRRTLVLDGPTVLGAGESRAVRLRLRSPLWVEEQLVPVGKEVDVQLAGILLLSDGNGDERVAELSFPVLPA
jgi:methane monooxygenase/ammonia monooxygenase subunit A/methane monooxygenase/ammonia monooxygenase subunit B